MRRYDLVELCHDWSVLREDSAHVVAHAHLLGEHLLDITTAQQSPVPPVFLLARRRWKGEPQVGPCADGRELATFERNLVRVAVESGEDRAEV